MNRRRRDVVEARMRFLLFALAAWWWSPAAPVVAQASDISERERPQPETAAGSLATETQDPHEADSSTSALVDDDPTSQARGDATPSASPERPPLDAEGWRWAGCLAGLAVGGTTSALTLPRLVPDTDDGTKAGFAGFGLGLLGFAVTGGLCVAGLVGLPALAESGRWSEDWGYALAVAQLYGLLGFGVGWGAASEAGLGSRDRFLIGGGVGLGTALGGALLAGLILQNDDYDDRRRGMLFGSTLGLLVLLVGGLIVGAAGLEDAMDEVVISASATSIIASLGMTSLISARLD